MFAGQFVRQIYTHYAVAGGRAGQFDLLYVSLSVHMCVCVCLTQCEHVCVCACECVHVIISIDMCITTHELTSRAVCLCLWVFVFHPLFAYALHRPKDSKGLTAGKPPFIKLQYQTTTTITVISTLIQAMPKRQRGSDCE